MSSIKSLQSFFNEMKMCFQNAGNGVCEKRTFDFTIAGNNVRLHLTGDGLYSIISPALEHLQVDPVNTPSLEIFIWDEESSGTPLPNQPWDLSEINENKEFVFPHPDLFRISVSADREMLAIGDCPSRQVFIWIKDAKNILTHDYAAPLLHVFRKWIISDELGVVHAGCVGDANAAVLLVGKGGSGKSTVSLLSVLHGLDYLGDDYTPVKFGAKPEAFCLYNSGKLHADHLKRFPELERLAVNPGPDQYGKPVIYLHQHFPRQIAIQRNLKAIVAPVVTGKPDSRLLKVSAIETLKALALSTILQLRSEDKLFLRKMAELAQTLPGFSLELGTDTNQIVPLIKQLL